MKITIKKTGKKLEKLLKNVQDLNNQEIQIGHFSEQGLHYSGMTYGDLLKMWARGVQYPGHAGRIIQDAKAQWVSEDFLTHEVSRNSKVKLALDVWYKNLDKSDPTSNMLDDVGAALRNEYEDVFGRFRGPFMSGTDTPLEETGDLKEHTAYRTSKNKTIKGG